MSKKIQKAIEAQEFAVALYEAEVKIIGCVIGFNLVGKATRRRMMKMSEMLSRIRFGMEHYTIEAFPDAPIEDWSLSSQALIARGLLPPVSTVSTEEKNEIEQMFVAELLCEQESLESLTDQQVNDIAKCMIDCGASFDNLK